MENWQIVWRDGIAPQLSTAGLETLERALAEDDERLLQGMTTSPPPLQCMQQCGIEGACAVGFCAWQGDGIDTVGALEEFFARVCFRTDQRMGEPTACRRFLNWFDDAPRIVVRHRLLDEVRRVLRRRRQRRKLASVGNEAAA
jgi:hypothetical protein